MRGTKTALHIFFSRTLRFRKGCSPNQVDALLCPVPRDGYEFRLYFAQQVTTKHARNWHVSGAHPRTQLACVFVEGQSDRTTAGPDGVSLSWRLCDETDPSNTSFLIQLGTVLLTRPHVFAHERIGFVTAAIGNNDGGPVLMLVRQYTPVSDQHYIDDRYSGARIDSTAIRTALQRVLETQEATFHVHMHEHAGRPSFGKMDNDEIPRLIASFRAVAGSKPHGMLVLSLDSASATVWMPRMQIPSRHQ